MYDVFVRSFWKTDTRTGRRVPYLGRKTYLARGVTEAEAWRLCKQYNDTHKPGKRGRKAEYISR